MDWLSGWAKDADKSRLASEQRTRQIERAINTFYHKNDEMVCAILTDVGKMLVKRYRNVFGIWAVFHSEPLIRYGRPAWVLDSGKMAERSVFEATKRLITRRTSKHNIMAQRFIIDLSDHGESELATPDALLRQNVVVRCELYEHVCAHSRTVPATELDIKQAVLELLSEHQ